MDADEQLSDRAPTGAVNPSGVLPWIMAAVNKPRPLILTVKSVASGAHLTYRLRPTKRPETDRGVGTLVMVDLLTGPNNGADYTFLGAVYCHGGSLLGKFGVLTGPRTERPAGGGGSTIGDDAPSAKMLHWMFARLGRGDLLAPAAEVWHDGTCALCGRALTTPQSLTLGIGPVCLEKLGG